MSDEPSSLKLVADRQDRQDQDLAELREQRGSDRTLLEVLLTKVELMTEAYNRTTMALRLGIATLLVSAAGVIYFGPPG